VLAEAIGKPATVALRGRYRLGDIRHAAADMTAYEALFGRWQPLPIEAGVREYVDWLLGQPARASARLDASLGEMEREGLLLRSTQGT
jgi:dTDP-L-rhamnose 4-epimerase